MLKKKRGGGGTSKKKGGATSKKKGGGHHRVLSTRTCGAKYENGVAYCFSRKTVDTEYTYYSWCMTSTDIVKWRKSNDYENFDKGMIYMKILKKGGEGSREKGGVG